MAISTVVVALALGASGVFAWTLAEYVLHRFVMHELRGRGLPSREHLLHHADPRNHLGRPVLSWIGIVLVGLVLFAPSGWLLGILVAGQGAVGLSLFGGWLLGYGVYERIHNRSHTHAPRTAYGRWARIHHFHHHHGHPLTNHGVTTPLWDVAFGTLERAERIRVPRRHAMPWLVHEDGSVRAAYADRYELVGPTDTRGRLQTIDRARAFANLAPRPA